MCETDAACLAPTVLYSFIQQGGCHTVYDNGDLAEAVARVYGIPPSLSSQAEILRGLEILESEDFVAVTRDDSSNPVRVTIRPVRG